MTACIVTTFLGLILVILGVINMTGNISTLHSYHRHRVSEKDRKPFGRMVGAGTLIIGVSLILFGGALCLFDWTKLALWMVTGMVVLFVGLGVGIGLSFYAMVKYNKGIF